MHLESSGFQSTTDAVVTKTTLPNGNDSKVLVGILVFCGRATVYKVIT